MSLIFGIPNELDVGSILMVAGNFIGATGGRLQAGSGSNSTLMVSDSGNFTNIAALTAASGVLAGQTASSGNLLYGLITGLSGFDLGDFATIANLQSTGQSLYSDITGGSGVTPVTNKQIIFSKSNVLSGDPNFTWDTTGGFLKIGTGVIFPWNPLSITSGNIGYTQVTLMNPMTTSGSSADFIVTADSGNDNIFYADFGINNSVYNQIPQIGSGFDGYVYIQGGTGSLSPGRGNLYLGTTSSGTFTFLFAGNVSGNPSAAIDASGINLPAGFTYRIGNISLSSLIASTGQTLFNLIASVSGGFLYDPVYYTSVNFQITGATNNYTWSGAGTGIKGTGILPNVSAYSGYVYNVKNQCTGAQLLISGYIDQSTNFTIYPLDSYTFSSDGLTWNVS